MASLLSNFLGNQVLLNNFTANKTWIALHTADPGPSGNLSTEVRGGGYERHPATWTQPSAKTIATANAMTFNDLRPNLLTYLAVWDRADGGNLLIRMALPTPVNVAASGNFIVRIGDIAFTL